MRKDSFGGLFLFPGFDGVEVDVDVVLGKGWRQLIACVTKL